MLGPQSSVPLLGCALCVSGREEVGSVLTECGMELLPFPQALCFCVVCSLLRQSAAHVRSLSGGLDVKTQEAALRSGPDILIATPGRLIDHLHNCPSFHLSSVEVLILDEADR